MNRYCRVLFPVLILIVAPAPCLRAADVPAPASASTTPPPAKPTAIRKIEWDELLPKDERDNFDSAPPAPIHDYLGGGSAARQSGSFSVNLTLNGAGVKIPGFVVPLEVTSEGMVKEFFLVPYFGACIHVPPPPPNQIVYVKLHQAVKVNALDDAQWVTGRLRTETKNSRFGAAAYTLDADGVEPYKY